jgi:Flp pilus assembly protein TadG
MSGPIVRVRRFVTAFCEDTGGVILPYAALLLVVFVGLMGLALDSGRQVSLQTQMQSIADALALAGARELNQQAGAQDRATSAMNALVSNGLTGMGYSGSISHSVAFYSALPAAATSFAGTTASSDTTTKFVAVTVSPVTLASTFMSGGLGAGAQAIAGFTSRAACDIPPVFICNPYETVGNTDDAAATAALRSNLADPAVERKLIRMDRTKTGPGHFGFLVPPDGCNGASCLKDWIAKAHPSTCYQTQSVDLNTGAMASVNDAFNVRFDMYGGSLKYSADYAPSVNVRKGFLPSKGGKDPWCSADVPSGATNPHAPYYSLPITTGLTGATTKTSATISAISPGTSGLIVGNPLLANPLNGLSSAAQIATIPNTTSVTVSGGNANKNGTGVALSSKGITSGFPLDSNMTNTTVIYGNGDWNCLDYWKVNHKTAAAPAGCTKANPTISRYKVYRYEIDNNLVNDWSAGPDGTSYPDNTAGNKNSENGAPLCAGAGNGVDTSTGATDRRVIFAAIINCEAQSALIGVGGANANNIPLADFGKFFMTQPVGVNDPKVDPNSLYGEMAGLLSSLDKVVIMNQVQLYR